jgi:hypothetical protein
MMDDMGAMFLDDNYSTHNHNPDPQAPTLTSGLDRDGGKLANVHEIATASTVLYDERKQFPPSTLP